MSKKRAQAHPEEDPKSDQIKALLMARSMLDGLLHDFYSSLDRFANFNPAQSVFYYNRADSFTQAIDQNLIMPRLRELGYLPPVQPAGRTPEEMAGDELRLAEAQRTVKSLPPSTVGWPPDTFGTDEEGDFTDDQD